MRKLARRYAWLGRQLDRNWHYSLLVGTALMFLGADGLVGVFGDASRDPLLPLGFFLVGIALAVLAPVQLGWELGKEQALRHLEDMLSAPPYGIADPVGALFQRNEHELSDSDSPGEARIVRPRWQVSLDGLASDIEYYFEGKKAIWSLLSSAGIALVGLDGIIGIIGRPERGWPGRDIALAILVFGLSATLLWLAGVGRVLGNRQTRRLFRDFVELPSPLPVEENSLPSRSE